MHPTCNKKQTTMSNVFHTYIFFLNFELFLRTYDSMLTSFVKRYSTLQPGCQHLPFIYIQIGWMLNVKLEKALRKRLILWLCNKNIKPRYQSSSRFQSLLLHFVHFIMILLVKFQHSWMQSKYGCKCIMSKLSIQHQPWWHLRESLN